MVGSLILRKGCVNIYETITHTIPSLQNSHKMKAFHTYPQTLNLTLIIRKREASENRQIPPLAVTEKKTTLLASHCNFM